MANHLDRIGRQIGDYRLLRWLGGGGFGNVYLAEHVRDHSQVAFKLLHIRLNHNEELKAFVNEARTILLKHAHIVPLLDFAISREDIPFLVMEYVAQGTLRDHHPKGSQVPLPLVINYAQQVASALQYAHEQLLIHRDVKPENMLLRADGTVLLSDFGLVAVAHSLSSLSPHQMMGGTLPYMAPEQIQGKAQTASDQYSLGVVVYEWITGRRPFEGTATEVAMQHMMVPPPSLVVLVPTLASAVEVVVLKALAKDPEDRFVTVQDFTTALEQAVREAPDISSSFIMLPFSPPVMSDQYDTSLINDNEYSTSPIGDNERNTSPPTRDHELLLSPNTSLLPVPSSYPNPVPALRVDWGGTLTVPIFYGREEEQVRLSQWVVQERCRVVSVLGMGGIGKSALVMSVTHLLGVGTHRDSDLPPSPCASCPFEVVIFRSLHNAPSCEALLDDCLQVLSPQPISIVPATLERRINLLLDCLHKVRVLMVLDNLEGLLEPRDVKGHFRSGFEGYEQLLQRVAETGHQSCLLLTSRETPASLRPLISRYSSARSLHLRGLDVAACKQLLEEKMVVGTEPEKEQLIEIYAGNPLALKIVAETIVDLFGGEIGPFLGGGMVIFGSIADLLGEQFARLSALEQSVLCWLAIMREPVSLGELQALLVVSQLRVQVFEAVDAGYRHCLIECGKRPGSFTLQPVVLEYVTQLLITEGSREIQQHRLDKLIQYGLEQARVGEYVRQMQERLLISPLLTELHSTYPRQTILGTREGNGSSLPASTSLDPAEEQLLTLLDELRELPYDAQGYGPANLIALLRVQRGHLSGLDLSQLSLRGAYLQGIEMQDASLTRALIRDCIFTEAVNATWAVAISLDGKLWAAGGIQGKVRVWNEEDQTYHLIWQAHTSPVQTLAFSPDGQTLASAGGDGTIKQWNLHNAALLWMGWQEGVQSLTFSPDGSLLASAGLDATVRLWDTGCHEVCLRGRNLQTLSHPSGVFAVAWSPDGDLLASGCFFGEIRLWARQKTEPATCVKIRSVQTNWVTSLAFAPDGRTLASANGDRTVKLWEVDSLRMLHTLPGHMDKVNCIAWSPDGHILASSSDDKGILLWDIVQGRHRAALLGHTSDINSMTFTPDGSCLLSGGADSTLRMWDVANARCVHIIRGYGVSLYDVDWSPDGMQLVSGGTDGLVTVWDLSGGTPSRVLHGHDGAVCGVRWSPDGRFLISCGWDAVMRLWNPTSGACVQMDPSAMLECIAWSLDGSLLACGTYLRGVQVWDMTTRSLLWFDWTRLIAFTCVAWSPDSTQLAGTGNDGSVYLWKGRDGTLLQKLQGHQGRAMSVAWSPDGTRLVSGSGELFVWDVQSGECVQTFTGDFGVVTTVVWSRSPTDAVAYVPCATGIRNSPCDPCGDLLITGSSDGILRWWDVQSSECVSMREAHQGTVQSLRISPDGRRLASCGDDGAIRIRELCSGDVLTLRRDRPCERLNITEIKGLTEAQKTTLHTLGAVEET